MDSHEATPFDVVSNLPLEVSVFIFSLLPLSDLASARQVSRGWEQVGSHDALWWLLYEQHYKRAPGSQKASTFMDAFRARQNKQSRDQATSQLDVFRNKTKLDRRWLRGQYKVHSFQAHELSVNGVKFLSSDHAPPHVALDKPDRKTGRKADKKDKQKEQDESEEQAIPGPSMVLLTWSDDCTIKIWQPYAAKTDSSSSSTSTSGPNAECSLTLQGHRSLVFTADSDGRVIVSGGVDERMILWQMDDGKMIDEIPNVHPKGIEKLQLHRNNVVTCGGIDATPKLWDIETKQCLGSFNGHKGRVFTLAANFEENLLVTAGSGATFRCWDMRTRECVLLVTNNSNKIGQNMNEALRLQERLLFTGDSGGDVKVWDLRQLGSVGEENFWLTPLTTYQHGDRNIYTTWNDETKLVSVAADNILKFWQLDESSLREPYHSKPLHEAHLPSVWTMQGDERALVCGARDGSVKILDFGEDAESTSRKKRKNANCLLQ